MSVVLIGYRGSGKTTVGRLLAHRLGHPFVDTDELIVRKAGKSIKEMFEQHGEPAFRDVETDVIRAVAMLHEHVIGLGGGSLEREQNRAALREGGHQIVYLRCESQELLRRIRGDPQTIAARPNLSSLGGGLEEIERLLARREPIYREMSHAELDVTRLSPADVTSQIMLAIAACGGGAAGDGS